MDPTALRITKQSAQGCQGKVIRPYTIDSRSASRHHTDSLGANTAREKGFEGPAHRRRDCVDVIRNAVHRTSPGLQPSGENRYRYRFLCMYLCNVKGVMVYVKDEMSCMQIQNA